MGDSGGGSNDYGGGGGSPGGFHNIDALPLGNILQSSFGRRGGSGKKSRISSLLKKGFPKKRSGGSK